MKIINTSKNTIYVEDLDLHLPYLNGETQDIDPELLKKSRCLRSFVLSDMMTIVSHDPKERVESSLVYLKHKAASTPAKVETEVEVEAKAEAPALEPVEDEIEVKIQGIFYDAGGYAKVNRNLAMKLHEAGFKVKIDAKRSTNQLNEAELADVVKLSHTQISRKHILIDSIIPSFSEASTGAYKVLYTTIESYTVPKQFIECCQFYNEIWLTSDWSADILRKHLPDKPIYSVPTGADPDLYKPHGPRFDFRPNVKDFIFLSVFGWNYRKGYDVLCKAYFDEFSAEDNVSLIIMSRYQSGHSRFHKNKIRDDIDEIMKKFPNKDLPHLLRCNRVIPEQEMPNLYRAADCFILTTRGEGGNLCAPEAALCGLPIIMTNCSGQQGYLRADNSYMIEIDHLQEIRPGQMHLHYWDGQQFPALTSTEVHMQVRQAMRSTWENYSEAQLRNNNMRKMIMNSFTWNHTANAAAKRLKEISRKMRG